MENLLSFFEDAPEAFWVIDQSYRLVYANKAFFITIENLNGKIIHIGDNVLDIEPEGSDYNLFWKSCYERAFQFQQYSAEAGKKEGKTKARTKYDFRLIEYLTKFLCVRAVTFSDESGEFKYTTLSNDNLEFTLSIDEDGNILRISPAVKNILGYLTDYMENKSVIDFLHPEEKDLLKNFFGANESMEGTWCRIRDVNGKYFWCNIQMAAFGKMHIDRKYVITINEIRIQKTAANSFVPHTNILQVISEAQGEFINTADAKKACEICLLYFQEEGIAPFSFVAGLDWKGTQPALKIIASSGTWVLTKENPIEKLLKQLSGKCYETQKGINNNVPLEINNGFVVEFENTYFMLYFLVKDSELIGVLVTSDFLTDGEVPQVNPVVTYFRQLFVSVLQSSRFIKNANAVLHTLAVSKDELQSLVTSLDDIILEVNINFELVNIWCNDEAMLSLPRELMTGKKIKEIKGEELGGLLEEAITKVIKTESSNTIEYMDPLGDKIEWFSAKMNLVKMFNGEKRVSILIQDITQRKAAEAIISDTLKKEKDLNEMKSRMITSVSHEFRTPLATIVSSTELLEIHIKKEYDKINKRSSELFANIYEEVDRLSDMMRNFLVMGRFEENQTPFRPKSTDIRALVQRIVHTRFNTKYGEEKVKIKVCNEPVHINIDPSLFWHILSNLISNAIKYSSEEETIEVELNFLENEVTLSVKDNGIGIPEDDLPNIFQSFYRAVNSDGHSGYGLGLAIVERFVKMHGASIEVLSEVGKGSTFIVHFEYQKPKYLNSKYQIHEKDQVVIN